MLVYEIYPLGFRCREMFQFEDGSYNLYKWAERRRYHLSTDLAGWGSYYRTLVPAYARILVSRYVGPMRKLCGFSWCHIQIHVGLGCRYLAGLCEADMQHALLWRSHNSVFSKHRKLALKKPVAVAEGPQQGQYITRIPSWFWLALQGLIMQSMLLKTKSF